jgi:hypothetical protein
MEINHKNVQWKKNCLGLLHMGHGRAMYQTNEEKSFENRRFAELIKSKGWYDLTKKTSLKIRDI